MLYKEKIKQLRDRISSIEEQVFAIELSLDFDLNSDSKVKVNILNAIYNGLVDLKNNYQSLEIGNNYGIRERNKAIKTRNLEGDHSPELTLTGFFNETVPCFLKVTSNLNCFSIQSFYEKSYDYFRNNIFFQTCTIEPIEEYETGEEYEHILELIAESENPRKNNIVCFKQAEQ